MSNNRPILMAQTNQVAQHVTTTIVVNICQVCGSDISQEGCEWQRVDDYWLCGTACKEMFETNPLPYSGDQAVVIRPVTRPRKRSIDIETNEFKRYSKDDSWIAESIRREMQRELERLNKAHDPTYIINSDKKPHA